MRSDSGGMIRAAVRDQDEEEYEAATIRPLPRPMTAAPSEAGVRTCMPPRDLSPQRPSAPGVLLAASLIATFNISKVSRERRPRRLCWRRALPPQRVPTGTGRRRRALA